MDELECPGCGLRKGVTKGLVGGDAGDMVFLCPCGSEALIGLITPAGNMRLRCMLCGTDHWHAVFKGPEGL